MSKLVLARIPEIEDSAMIPEEATPSVMPADFLADLNQVQREAASAINGPVLIVAGAGSGKTRVLIYRTAYLLAQGISPWNILALTFTNKAAGAMKDRIARLVD